MIGTLVRSSLLILLVIAAGCSAEQSSSFDASGVTDAGTLDDAAGSAEDGGSLGGLPCDVERILQSRCQSCHAASPQYGAPMPLVTLADLHAAAKSDPSKRVMELVRSRINDPLRPMPPTGDLPATEASVLSAWVDAGGLEGAGCSGTDGGTPIADAGPPLSCTPTHRFTAHASNDVARGFPVPSTAANLYQCFTFRSPFDGQTQGTLWSPIIADARVLHHWILYRTATPQPDNGVMPCQMPRDAVFVAGWAPGGGPVEMPDGVGLELPGANEWLILQVHYHNGAGYTDANDASGVELCTTATPRPNVAGVITLGTVAINIPSGAVGYEASHVCGSNITSRIPAPLHLLSSFPHMHQRGVGFRTEILRGGNDGPSEMLVDVERFSFDDQRQYRHDPPVMLNPGDALRTTCVYNNDSGAPVHFGERTEDEMCFNFLLLYPIDIFGTRRQCVGLF